MAIQDGPLTAEDAAAFFEAYPRSGCPITFAPGPSQDAVVARVNEAGLTLPSELRVWLAAFGAPSDPGHWTLPDTGIHTLDEALDSYALNRSISAEVYPDDPEDDPLREWWLPLARNVMGDEIVADTSVADADAAPIATTYYEGDTPAPVAASYGRVVRGWTACIEAGVYVWDRGVGKWEHHPELAAAGTDVLYKAEPGTG